MRRVLVTCRPAYICADGTANESRGMVQTSDLYTKSRDNEASPPKSKKSLQRLAEFLPIALLLAFLLLLALLFGDRFVPARELKLESVVTQRSQQTVSESASNESNSAQDFSGKALFQASGWIEADPLPFHVPALSDGFVDTVHVLEGEQVAKGQLLAKLVDEDAQLDLASAKAARGEKAAALKEMQAMVRTTQAALQRLGEEVEIEEARLEELRDDETRLLAVGSKSVSEQEIAKSRLRVLTQRAVIQALQARQGELEAELAARSAAVERTKHELQSAETDLARKQLALDRMIIRSPIDGIIQKLYVSPGYKRIARMDDPESSTVAKIFDPKSLQARIDVPLEEAAQLQIGQLVRLRSVFLQDKVFEGRVSRIYGQADLQRNTLQAKVQLLSPSDGLRPEMLCRAEFLAPASGSTSQAAQTSHRAAVYTPRSSLVERSGAHYVWTLDSSGKRVALQPVSIEAEERDGYVLVNEGLKPGAQVVINPPSDLKEGDRVRTSN
ncbi:MAG: efflux RND transporter periplasmic adaptor subunit [Coraliomargarita sp.]